MAIDAIFGVPVERFSSLNADSTLFPYDFSALRYAFDSVADDGRDKARVVEWYAESKVFANYSEDTKAIVVGSVSAAHKLGRQLMSLGFDVSDATAWESLRAICCAATLRACFCKHIDGVDGAPSFAREVSALVQLCVDTVLQRKYSANASIERSTPVIFDFVCGRGAGWTRVCVAQAIACGLYSGADVREAQRRVGSVVMGECVSAISDARGMGVRDASSAFGSEIVRVAQAVNMWQTGIVFRKPSGADVLSVARDWALWNKFSGEFDAASDGAVSHTGGVFKAFGVDATRGCVCLTPDIESTCAKTYVDVCRANESLTKTYIDTSRLV